MVARLTAEVRSRLDGRAAPLVVAIDGRSGTGKSTLARDAAPRLEAAVIEVDTFFGGGDDGYWRTRTPAQRNAEVIDWARLRAEALEPLRSGRAARWRPFDYETWEGLAGEPITLGPAPVVLVEGAYSAGPWLADLVDVSVLVTLAGAVRLDRLARREGPERTARWLSTWRPAEDRYFVNDRPPESFDVVLGRDESPEGTCIEALPPSDPRAERALHVFMEEMSSRWLGRPATEDDLREAFREFPSDDLEPPQGLLLVAHRGDVVEGCAGLRHLDAGLGEVKRVWVSPALRRQGLGRRLMAEIERHAVERGVRELRLDTRGDLVEARRLYERLGYREVPPFGENPYAGHWFAKRLDR